jgi:hypothetical protein
VRLFSLRLGLVFEKPFVQFGTIGVDGGKFSDLQAADWESVISLPALDGADIATQVSGNFTPRFETGFVGGRLRHLTR